MRKKLTLLFALLCASVMGFAIDWSGIGWIGSTDPTYNNQFKVSGKDVVNIQNPWNGIRNIYYFSYRCKFGMYSTCGGFIPKTRSGNSIFPFNV